MKNNTFVFTETTFNLQFNSNIMKLLFTVNCHDSKLVNFYETHFLRLELHSSYSHAFNDAAL